MFRIVLGSRGIVQQIAPKIVPLNELFWSQKGSQNLTLYININWLQPHEFSVNIVVLLLGE